MTEADKTEEVDPPAHFLCPISKSVMVRPMFLVDDLSDNSNLGHTYEEADISRWLDSSNRDPITNAPLGRPRLIANRSLRDEIALWAARTGYELPVPVPYISLQQQMQVSSADNQPASQQASLKSSQRSACHAKVKGSNFFIQLGRGSSPTPE